MSKQKNALAGYIRSIPNHPKPGILFRDITTLLKDKKAFRQAVRQIVDKYRNKKIAAVVAVEARGFILGGAVAYQLNAGFVPVRKKGKLPAKTNSVTYDLEYGTDTLEIHQDAFAPGTRILIIDDLLATGGTIRAVTDLIHQLKGKIIGIACLIELTDLNGREKLKGLPIRSLIRY